MDKKEKIIKIIEDSIYLDIPSNLVADKILNLFEVGVTFKEKEKPSFRDWWISEGYMPTNNPNVYKNGLHLILMNDLVWQYLLEVNRP